jgi:hypothetical protein
MLDGLPDDYELEEKCVVQKRCFLRVRILFCSREVLADRDDRVLDVSLDDRSRRESQRQGLGENLGADALLEHVGRRHVNRLPQDALGLAPEAD